MVACKSRLNAQESRYDLNKPRSRNRLRHAGDRSSVCVCVSVYVLHTIQNIYTYIYITTEITITEESHNPALPAASGSAFHYPILDAGGILWWSSQNHILESHSHIFIHSLTIRFLCSI